MRPHRSPHAFVFPSLRRYLLVAVAALAPVPSHANDYAVRVYDSPNSNIGFDTNDFYDRQPDMSSSLVDVVFTYGDIADARLFVVSRPDEDFGVVQLAAMDLFVRNGGRIWLVGEAGDFVAENGRLNTALAYLGSAMSIDLSVHDGMFHTATVANGQILPHRLTEGVNTIHYAKVGRIVGSGPDQRFLLTQNLGNVWSAEETIGTGSIVLTAESSMIVDVDNPAYDNGRLYRNMVLVQGQCPDNDPIQTFDGNVVAVNFLPDEPCLLTYNRFLRNIWEDGISYVQFLGDHTGAHLAPAGTYWVPPNGSFADGRVHDVATIEYDVCDPADDCGAERRFEQLCYRGAVPPPALGDDWTRVWTCYGTPPEVCRPTLPPSEVALSGALDTPAELNWSADNYYVLQGRCHVPAGFTLTIAPGTVALGDSSGGSYLVIEPDAHIDARGTRDQPIVFTSDTLVPGQWGGIVIQGHAVANCGSCGTGPGCPGVDGQSFFCGGDDCDSSGVLQYVRVEYGGAPAAQGSFAGFEFAGVGSRTVAEHLQAHWCAGDAFRFDGGRTNARYLVATGPGDDGIEWNHGFRGTIQSAVIQMVDFQGDHGIEGGNNDADPDALPRSNPLIANVTAIGPGIFSAGTARDGLHLRSGSGSTVLNSIFTEWPQQGYAVEDPSSTCGGLGVATKPNGCTESEDPCDCERTWWTLGSTGPTARWSHGTAYDPLRGELVLFGGFDGTGRLGDTWIWNGGTWSQRFPTDGPGPRVEPGMVFDRVRGVVVLVGGAGDSGALGDVWEWGGAEWAAAPALPGAAYGMGIAFDPVREVVVVYGGFGDTGRNRNTWEYNGASWTLISDNSPPGYRAGHQLTWLDGDLVTAGRSILFAGQTPGGVVTNDNGYYTATGWTVLGPGGPPPRYRHRMTRDPCGRLYLFGGYDNQSGIVWNDLWSLDAASGWSPFAPTSPWPGERWLHSFDFFGATNRLVVFGGRDADGNPLGDTWVWGCNAFGVTAPEVAAAGPQSFLGPVHPNPFRAVTTIEYAVPGPVPVRLGVYDVAGRLVRHLADGQVQAPGGHRTTWDGRNGEGQHVGAGIYFLRLEAGDLRETRRVTLIR